MKNSNDIIGVYTYQNFGHSVTQDVADKDDGCDDHVGRADEIR